MYRKFKKYGNTKTIRDGIAFDSQREARRYLELKSLQKCGLIKSLRLQPRYLLQEAFTHKLTGCKHRKIEYVADFEYEERGKIMVEDSKGMQTDVFKLKAKLFDYKYPDLTLIIS